MLSNGFYQKNVLLYKGKDNEQSVDITFLVKESYISKSDGEIQWYPEPYFTDRDIVGTLRHVECIRVTYQGSFEDNM